MKDRDVKPLFMWFMLLTGILVLAFLRPIRIKSIWTASAVNFDIVFVISYLLGMLRELPINKKDVNTVGKTISDFGTCQIYGMGQALTILSALWCPSLWETPNLAHYGGLLLFLSGSVYRHWAIDALGPLYSHKVQTVAQHKIITRGPYRFTRHPAYAGMLIAHAGVCLYFFNWVTLGVFSVILAPAILLRIRIEEKILYSIEGYREFAKSRKRLFPAVW